MKVILLKDVPKLGRKDDIVDVNQGHAINMLIPKKLARPANATDIANNSKKKELNQKNTEEKIRRSKEILHTIHGQVVNISEKANDKGHLFSKVHLEEILNAVKNQFGFSIEKNWIKELEPIKNIGEYKINVEAFGEKVSFLLNVRNL